MSHPKNAKNFSPRKLPTEKQAKTAQGVRQRVRAGEPFSKDLLIEETMKNYKCDGCKTHTPREMAATIVGQNLRKPVFLATLGLTDPEAQVALKDFLWRGLQGENSLWPKDKQLAMKCADLLSKGAIASREQIVHTDQGDFEGRSIEELRFFELHDRFPNPQELEEFKAARKAK